MGVVLDNLGQFRTGVLRTIGLTLFGFGGAFLIGLVIASCRVSPVPPLRLAGAAYVGTVRNIPLIVQMFLVFFGLPKLGIVLEPFTCAWVVLAVYTGSYVAEVVRSGINAVAAGQAEAARAIGLSFGQVLLIVVLPQALRTVVQPLGNLFIACTKNSAVAYAISVIELTGTSDRLGVAAAESLAVLFAAGLGYLALTLPSGLLIGVLERKVAIKR